MAKKTKGPVFLRFFEPVLETLKEMGGSGKASDVTDAVLTRVQIPEDERSEVLASGRQRRVHNQIGWARFYLSKAGLIEGGAQRGVWTLTPRGRRASIKGEDAAFNLFKRVHDQFQQIADDIEGSGAAPEEEEIVPIAHAGDSEIESDDEDAGSEEIHSPYDASKTHIMTKPMSVEQLAKRMSYDEIDLMPDFQRRANLWTEDKKSRLIESMLIRIPLPVLYFDATEDTKWLVVDGLQRLSTIYHFMVEKDPKKRLQLQGLEYLRQHEGKTFGDLPRDLQRRIEETQVFAHLIQPGTPIEVKYNIFKRINTGGLVLTAQEIRHALYQKAGGVNQLLRELADSVEFREATDGAISDTRMLDCEFVLRFISFSYTPYKQYTEANMDAFLNAHMKRLNDEGEGSRREDLRRRFRQAMRAARRIFDNDAFRKRFSETEARKPINKALFEVWSVALGNLDPASIEKLVGRRDNVRSAFIRVLNEDKEFEVAISQGTGDVGRVHKRFSTVEKIVREVLGGSR